MFDQLTLDSEDHNKRLDRLLHHHFPTLPYGLLRKSLRSKMIRVNMKKATADQLLQPGDVVRIPSFYKKEYSKKMAAPSTTTLPKEYILYEDKDLIVINKPSGLPSQGGRGITHHLDQMLESLPKKNGFRPSGIHRLDRDTSGCLIIAKKRSIAAQMGSLLKEGQIEKYYVALTRGTIEQNIGIIDCPLVKDHAQEMMVVDRDHPQAKDAQTSFIILDYNANNHVSLVMMRPHTGRTHQLRVHMQSQQSPILGDQKYGKPFKNIDRLCLHAYHISFIHPITQKEIHITAPLPEHITSPMKQLGLSESPLKEKSNKELLKL